MTDQEVRNGLTERDTLLLSMLGEARGEEVEGRIAVACVIRNRMRDDRWPDTLKDVCLQRWQFSCWNGGDANYATLMATARLLVSDYAIKSTFKPDPIFRETQWVADGILDGVVRDRTTGANHYMTRKLWESGGVSWSKDKRPTGFIGAHVFFRL